MSSMFADPSKVSFLAVQITIFSVAMLTMILSFNKPWYIPKRNENQSNCPTLDEVLVQFLSPFEYYTKNNGKECRYSCPFPDNLTEFRGAMCCVSIVFVMMTSFYRLGPWTEMTFFAWNSVFGVMGILWFALFVLDTNATDLGYNFCDEKFKIKDEVNSATYQFMTTQTIQDCDSSRFAWVCCLDLLMTTLAFTSVYLVRKYMFFITSQAPATKVNTQA